MSRYETAEKQSIAARYTYIYTQRLSQPVFKQDGLVNPPFVALLSEQKRVRTCNAIVVLTGLNTSMTLTTFSVSLYFTSREEAFALVLLPDIFEVATVCWRRSQLCSSTAGSHL